MSELTHVILDVDDVILDMDDAAVKGEEAVRTALEAQHGATVGASVYRRFSDNYDVLRQQLRAAAGVAHAAFTTLRQRICAHQRGVLDAGYDAKLFSRECLLACALEDHGIGLSSATVVDVIGRYWAAQTEATRVYPDAAAYVGHLRAAGVAMHLATNSDGFIDYDDAAGAFVYDPARARDRKWDRMAASMAQLDLGPDEVTIGDPVGKPDPRYYDEVIARFERAAGGVDWAHTAAVGDSLTSDITPYLALGVAKGAWVLRDRSVAAAAPPAPANVVIVEALGELQALW